MDWSIYKQKYTSMALDQGIETKTIEENLSYAEVLYHKQLPIIYDEVHLGQLTGISHDYMFKVSNDSKKFYKTFRIKKRTGGYRKISEPLPNLKIIQNWILNEILYKIETHPSAKAYRKDISLRENVKFHRNQEIVLKLDIQSFFNNIREKYVYRIFKELGYKKNIANLLTKLCTLSGSLPQGAVTSPYLSNLILRKFDKKIYTYCRRKAIRYTRYADDLSFSGKFNKHHLISRVENELSKLKLKLNTKKIRILRSHQQQIITGIVVNEKIQVSKKYRKLIRQEVYYINKYGLDNHLSVKYNLEGIDDLKKNAYLKSLIGKAEYVLFINKNDKEMPEYIMLLRNLLVELKSET
ncbi:reverse transcriptase [Bacillus cereus]|uniref:retron St85 family RNA-directed DNA polymerase n=1 Tax=Bacillus cereus TaxID=1396 RepID=UPI000BF6AA2D|nr:retron St85 family RNA-directed DNA polymerase [Bacillus cereus]PFC23503.1 reverse transcriptase [Bacillus cereus]